MHGYGMPRATFQDPLILSRGLGIYKYLHFSHFHIRPSSSLSSSLYFHHFLRYIIVLWLGVVLQSLQEVTSSLRRFSPYLVIVERESISPTLELKFEERSIHSTITSPRRRCLNQEETLFNRPIHSQGKKSMSYAYLSPLSFPFKPLLSKCKALMQKPNSLVMLYSSKGYLVEAHSTFFLTINGLKIFSTLLV